MAVGVFDSGLGGLTVLDAVSKRLPDVPFVYFADSAHAPYGVRDADDIYELTTAAVERLWDAGCDLVILACNTASAAALRRMQENWIPPGKRVLGVFVPLIEALTERQWGDNSPPREVGVQHVALFATPATVSSRAPPAVPLPSSLSMRGIVFIIATNWSTTPCTALTRPPCDGANLKASPSTSILTTKSGRLAHRETGAT